MEWEKYWQDVPPDEPPASQGRTFAPEETAFIEEIHRKSYKDPPRLAYADWLNERGDPLGEFIERQCAHGYRMPNFYNSAWGQYIGIHPRDAELVTGHWHEWVWSCNNMLYLRLVGFHRGLPSGVSFRIDDGKVLRHLERAKPEDFDRFLGEVSPLLRFRLRLFDTPGLPALLAHPLMTRVDRLELDGVGREPGTVEGLPPSGPVSEASVRALGDCPYLLLIERVDVRTIDAGARECFAKIQKRHGHVHEWP